MCGGGSERWRALMDATRAVAVELVEGGVIEITRRGAKVNADAIRGPIRLRLRLSRDEFAVDASRGEPSTGGAAVKVQRVARLETRVDRKNRSGSDVAAARTRAPADAKRRKTKRD